MTPKTTLNKKLDWILIGCYIFLVIFGWMNIYSSSLGDASVGFDWRAKYGMQLIWIASAVLIALVIRGAERIVARGDTLLLAGDKVIVVTKAFEDTLTYLVEKTVKPGGKRAGHAISEVSDDGLVLLVCAATGRSSPAGIRYSRRGTCWCS